MKFDINTPDDMTKITAPRREQARKRKMNKDKMSFTEGNTSYMNHVEMANLMIKVINVLNIEPVIKKVVSMRLMSPLTHGCEKSYLSIALEIGTTEAEIKEIEKAGLELLQRHLSTVSAPDFMKKFNTDKMIKALVDKG